MEDGSYSGDYPDYSCQPCWELGLEFRHKIIALRNKTEAEEEILINQWIAEAKRDVT